MSRITVDVRIEPQLVEEGLESMLFNRVWNPSAELGHSNETIQKIGHTATPMGDANIKVWVPV